MFSKGRMIVPAAVGLCLLAAPAAADEPDAVSVKDPEKVTCKYEKVVDSRIPQKVCMTNFEWEERRRAQIEAERSSRNRNSGCGEGPC